MKFLSTTFLFCTLLSGTAHAQSDLVSNVSNKGTVAAAFLEIGVNARAEAMGGAFTAMRSSADMLYWNPAGTAFLNGTSLSFSHTKWLAETEFNYAAIAVPIDGRNLVIGGSFTTLGIPEQPVRSYDGSLTGEMYDARDYAASLSAAIKIIPTFAFGATVKYINQRIWSERADGFGFDVGVSYITPIQGVSMGASISNFGSDLQMDGKNLLNIIDPDPNNQGVTDIPVKYVTNAYPLPQIFRFGLAHEQTLGDITTITAVDLMHPTGSTESMNIGLEAGFRQFFFVRAGYQNLFEKDTINGLTLGLGLQYMLESRQRFAFDYAFSEWGMLGSAHRISVSIEL
jgi:hypothetical protein